MGVLLLALGLRMIERSISTNPSFALAALSILFVLLIFMNPFGKMVALCIFSAITLIVETVMDAVYFILAGRRGREERAGS